jgi:hypothetical protein
VVCAGELVNFSFADPRNSSNNHEVGRTTGVLCDGNTQFPEALPGLSGFVTNATFPNKSVDAFSVVDLVLVPDDLEPGDYVLSWRWDCEQSPQIWQSCADITVQGKPMDWWMPFLVSVSVGGGLFLITMFLVIFWYTRYQKVLQQSNQPQDQLKSLLESSRY